MARFDDADDFLGRIGHFVHAAHGEIDLIHALSPGKVADHGIRDQDGLIGNLRLAEVVHAHLEDADDREGNSADLKSAADGRI